MYWWVSGFCLFIVLCLIGAHIFQAFLDSNDPAPRAHSTANSSQVPSNSSTWSPNNAATTPEACVPTQTNNESLDIQSNNGHGEIDISNHTDDDAVIHLVNVPSEYQAVVLYVKRQSDRQILNVSPGKYELRIGVPGLFCTRSDDRNWS